MSGATAARTTPSKKAVPLVSAGSHVYRNPSSKKLMMNRPIPYRRACFLPAHGAQQEIEELWGGPMPNTNDETENLEKSDANSPKKTTQRTPAISEHDIHAESSALMSGDVEDQDDDQLLNSQHEPHDEIVMDTICYKLTHQGLLGKYSVRKDVWEQKRLVLTPTQLLYYDLEDPEDDTTSTAAKSKKLFSTLSSSLKIAPMESGDTHHNNNDPPNLVPKGELDLVTTLHENGTTEGGDDPVPPPPPSILAQALPAQKGNPTPYSIQVRSPTVEWKFCFSSQTQQVKWLDCLVDILGTTGAGSDDVPHNFEAGDHIIRWEMLPILYPIQIHGIVMEAGKNCVIIADFGLTSYYQTKENETSQSTEFLSSEDKTHSTDNNENVDQQKDVMDAWKVLRPKEKKRLNVVALTDKKEIRQWSKVNYGHSFFSAEGNKSKTKKFTKWLSSTFSSQEDAPQRHKKTQIFTKDELEEATRHIATWEGRDTTKDTIQFEVTYEEPNLKDKLHDQLKDPDWWTPPPSSGDVDQEEKKDEEDDSEEREQVETQEEEDGTRNNYYDDTFHKKFAPVTSPKVFDLQELNPSPPEEEENTTTQDMKMNKLPKSDPTKIVLARTNFLLEFGEEVLPPYHVFHSNSECIAVWCKTGRWSTLQTAIFLHSTAVGNAKSATVMAMGVAAAHVFLLPVMAIGGIVAVSAPWMILKKSKHKWEEATMKLTELFWAKAEPEVFVEAIEHWSGLVV